MENEVTNPLLVMAINMSIVFGVLIFLGVLIQITYFLDPTRKRVVKPAAPAVASQPAPVAPASVVTNDDQIIAAITAAVVAIGYSASQIATVRPHRNDKWAMDGRMVGRNNTSF